MKSTDYLHIRGIVEDVPPTIVEQHLADIREKVRVIRGRIAVESYGAAPPFSIFDGS
ncbi:MAG: hypothetical protein AB7L36_03020 [Sphingomonadaceae bacterium]